jgi:5-methylcytosine-specific restriction endonuclease McrA
MDIIKILNLAIKKCLITKINAIRLLNYVKYGVLTCEICKKPFGKTNKNKTVDHILPKSKGGGNALENLQLAHRGCNIRKGNKILG